MQYRNELNKFTEEKGKYIFYLKLKFNNYKSSKLFIDSISKHLPEITFSKNYTTSTKKNRHELILKNIPVDSEIKIGDLYLKCKSSFPVYKTLQRDIIVLSITGKIKIRKQTGLGGQTTYISRVF